MAVSNKTPKKKTGKTPARGTKSRQVHNQPYKSFRLSKRIKQPKRPLPGTFQLFKRSFGHLKRHRRLFLTVVLIYLLLTVVMVKGFGVSMGVGELKSTLQEVFTGVGGSVVTGFALFAVLLGSTGSTADETTSMYQTILVVIVSLAIIWCLRQTHAGQKTTAREAFYKGMYPLIPFLLVLAVIALQLIPLLIGSWLYTTVISGGLAATLAEQVIWIVLIAMFALLSLYMVSSSAFALYIVTLPDMTPMKALRSAREIVRYRRWTVMRRALALPILLIVTGALIMVPLIIFVTPLAEWVFFVLNMGALAIVHSYMYTLYRELL